MNSLEAYEKLQNLKLELLAMKSSVQIEQIQDFVNWCVEEFDLSRLMEK